MFFTKEAYAMSHEERLNIQTGPTIEVMGDSGMEPMPLYPELVGVNIAEFATTPVDDFIAGAVNDGRTNSEIAAALHMDPALVRFHTWRLVAMGDVISRGPAESGALPPLQSDASVDDQPDPRLLGIDLPAVVDDSLLGYLPPVSKHASLKVSDGEILAFALRWPYEHPYRVINLVEFARQHGMTPRSIPPRYVDISRAMADHGVDLPSVSSDPRVDARLDAQLERMGPATANHIAQLLDASPAAVQKSQERLREQGIVRTDHEANGACTAAVAILRANFGLDNVEIAHILDVEVTTVMGQLQMLRQRRPDLTVFNLNVRPSAEAWRALMMHVQNYVDGPGAGWSPAEVTTAVAQDMGVPFDDVIYRSVWHAMKVLEKRKQQ